MKKFSSISFIDVSYSSDSVDYPDFAYLLIGKYNAGQCEKVIFYLRIWKRNLK